MVKSLLIVLLLLISGTLAFLLFWNSSGRAPAAGTKTTAPSPDYDVRLSIAEDYLERRVRAQLLEQVDRSAVQNLTIDVQPNNQIRAEGNAFVFGFPIPLSVTLRLVVTGGTLRTEAISGAAGPVRLPEPVLEEVQQSVNTALAEAAPLAGTGMEATGLESGDGALTVFLREIPGR